MLTAIVRPPSAAIARCELTYLEREPIDVARALAQHAAYVQCLRDLGVRVIELPAEPNLPDATFVEDTAVVTNAGVVLAYPGAPSRRDEVEAVAAALRPYHRRFFHVEPPGTLDGGDVLQIARMIFVGVGGRTNEEGARQLRTHLGQFGYDVFPVEFSGCLHLKTACTWLGCSDLLANPAWVDPKQFAGLHVLEVPPDEPFSANTLLPGNELLLPTGSPRTKALLERECWSVREVDISELQKAEAGVTCLSILFYP